MKLVRLQHLVILHSTAVVVASAFVPSTSASWGKPATTASRFVLQFKEQTDAEVGFLDEIVAAAPISDLLTNTNAKAKAKTIVNPPRPTKEKQELTSPSQENEKIVIPAAASRGGGKTSKRQRNSISRRVTTKSGLFHSLRPAMKFRAKLGLTAMAALSVACLLVPSPKLRLFMTAKVWWKSRGFTGLAAVGRSVTYMWALLVGYPRLLDRRAGEGRRRDQEKTIERRRIHLADLAGEVFRLRQELASIDAEIRAFRREIISLQVYAKCDESSFDVKEAIGAEMAHLAQLRSDTQANLAAAQQIWAEVRSQS